MIAVGEAIHEGEFYSTQTSGSSELYIGYSSVSQTVRRDSLGRRGITSEEASKKVEKTENKKLKIKIFYLTNFFN
jgi:hypothetical protein